MDELSIQSELQSIKLFNHKYRENGEVEGMNEEETRADLDR